MLERILWNIFFTAYLFVNDIIIVDLIISIILFMLILEYIHIPRYRISDDVKNQILNNGLIHFTLWERASEIQKDGLIPGKRKAMSIF